VHDVTRRTVQARFLSSWLDFIRIKEFHFCVHHEWRKSGAAALKQVAKDDPVQFVKYVASVLPREIDAMLMLREC
jgi:hypothetical protein